MLEEVQINIYKKKKELEINLKNKFTNINRLFNGRNNTIKLVDDYGSIILEVKIKVAEEPESEPEPSKKSKLSKKKSTPSD